MTMTTIFKSLIILSVFVCSSVFAIGLDEAKQQGLIGEKDNGYLGVVVMQNNIQQLVNDINAKRKAVYADLAAENGITIEQVEKLAAKKAYSKTETGHYLWMNGKWRKK
ncbi:YdbL family protein [uncultured Paraglaciecola sp.]|uniref:YdbL family protein n=1 Tax=uncultured Paraglaciecola sp. TaxID=1765024 RepID=UPI00262C497C|nr:YdbL family protein [uncultured Paraglaciecola sp.]